MGWLPQWELYVQADPAHWRTKGAVRNTSSQDHARCQTTASS